MITQILEILEIIKDIGNQTTTITEVPVITETITVETEVTVTIEIITITDTTIVDQVQDIQTEAIQDNSRHITKIIVIIAIIDKDTTAEILVETKNIDNVLIVTTDITQTIITKMTAEINLKKTITDIIIKNDAMMETDITIIIIIIIAKTINNVESDKQNDDPPGIDEYEYTSESSDEDQEILDKFYNANEDTCNTIINTLESKPTWILPMYQCKKFEQDFTKQKPILEIDSLLDSGATLNLLNEDTWNKIKYNNPEIHLEKENKKLTAANNTTIETFGTVTLTLTPDRISNNRNKPQNNFHIHFYVTQCNHDILGTPFFKEYIETINANTNRLTLNTNTILDNDIIFYMNSTKGYPDYSR